MPRRGKIYVAPRVPRPVFKSVARRIYGVPAADAGRRRGSFGSAEFLVYDVDFGSAPRPAIPWFLGGYVIAL